MSDIDFDELDRAVASVLVPTGSPAQQMTPAPVQPAATPQQPAPPVQPAVPTQTPVAVKTPINAADLHAAAPPPSRGRFLDMVHPSGDMSGRPTPAFAVKPPLAPAAAPVFATEPVIAGTPPPLSVQNQPLTAAPVTPIKDMSVVSPPVVQSSVSAPAAAQDFFAASPDDTAPHAAPVIVQPTPSPFIPDAKVEKRPLGSAPADFIPITPTVLTPPNDSLHAELSRIESESTVLTDPEPPVTPSAEPVALSVDSPANNPQPFSPAATAPVVDAPTPVEVPTVATQTTDPSPAPVITPVSAMAQETRADRVVQPLTTLEAPAFFTHKAAPAEPTADPVKHGRPAWIWITLAVAILMIGFGVGASLYFVVLK